MKLDTINVFSRKDLARFVRSGKYTPFGGYPVFFITIHGNPVSFDAVKANFKEFLRNSGHEAPESCDNDMRIAFVEVNWETPDLFCTFTGNRIESAYAEDEGT